MPRLIDADALIEYLDKRMTYELMNGRNRAYGKGVRDAIKDVESQPTIEAEPVRHGRWIDIWDENYPNTSTYGRCTECGQISKRPLGRYCRWCGAKMDEVSE